MERDHDYVTMADYVSDTDELASTAAQIIEGLQAKLEERERDARRFLAAVVIAAGGRVDVHATDIDFDPELVIEANPVTNGYTITAKRS
jgi:uncharacterized Rossmann fold enzyme